MFLSTVVTTVSMKITDSQYNEDTRKCICEWSCWLLQQCLQPRCSNTTLLSTATTSLILNKRNNKDPQITALAASTTTTGLQALQLYWHCIRALHYIGQPCPISTTVGHHQLQSAANAKFKARQRRKVHAALDHQHETPFTILRLEKCSYRKHWSLHYLL